MSCHCSKDQEGVGLRGVTSWKIGLVRLDVRVSGVGEALGEIRVVVLISSSALFKSWRKFVSANCATAEVSSHIADFRDTLPSLGNINSGSSDRIRH